MNQQFEQVAPTLETEALDFGAASDSFTAVHKPTRPDFETLGPQYFRMETG